MTKKQKNIQYLVIQKKKKIKLNLKVSIDLLNQVKEALSEINKDEKLQTKIDCYFKKKNKQLLKVIFLL